MEPITRSEMLMDGQYVEPKTRKEKILAGEDLEPITREEYFLKEYRHSGGDVDVVQLTATENKTYTAPEGKAYNPVKVNVPEPVLDSITINENGHFTPPAGTDGYDDITVYVPYVTQGTTINENGTYTPPEGVDGFGRVIVDVPTPPPSLQSLTASHNGYFVPSSGYVGFSEVNVDVALPNNAYLLESQKDDVVTIQHGAEFDMPKLIASIEPQQSGSGDPSPTNIRPISGWTEANVTRYGKNLLDVSKLSQQIVTSRGDLRPGVPVKLQAGTYTISAQSGSLPFYITRPENNYSYIAIDALPFTFSLDNEEEVIVRIAQPNISSWDYVNLQLEEGNTATTYEPFGNTYTINFVDGSSPLTVYGGTLNVLSGLLTITDGYISSYNGETLPSTWISDRDVYAEGTTPTTGAEVCYKLATPQTYQLTPTQVQSLLGVNSIYADTGEVDVQIWTKEV